VAGGISFIVISGTNFMPFAYTNTLLEEILPIKLSSSNCFKENVIVSLAPDFAGSYKEDFAYNEAITDLWQNVSPVSWCVFCEAASNADVILNANSGASDVSWQNSTIPLLVYGKKGNGDVFFMGFDESWKLNYLPGTKYYGKFWKKMIAQNVPTDVDDSLKNDAVRSSVDKRIYIEADQNSTNMSVRMLDKKQNILFSSVFSNFGGVSIPVADGMDYCRIEIYGIGMGGKSTSYAMGTNKASAYCNAAFVLAEKGIIPLSIEHTYLLPDLIAFSEKHNLFSIRIVSLWNNWLTLFVVFALIFSEWLVRGRFFIEEEK
jgi:hypothetical protein